jgi:hypothetical protein
MTAACAADSISLLGVLYLLFSREIEVACFKYIFIFWFDCTQARFDDQIEKAIRKNKLQKAE